MTTTDTVERAAASDTTDTKQRQRGSSIQRVDLANGRVRWRFRIDLEPDRDETGKITRRRQRTITCLTEREARDRQAEERTRIAKGSYIEPSTRTVRAVCDAWRDARALKWKPSTRETNRIALAPLLEQIGSVPVQKLTAEQIDRALGHIASTGGKDGNGRSAYTVRTAFICLKAALTLAHRRDYVAKNVAESVEPPRVDDRERDVWSREQLQRFLDHVDGDEHAAGWHLAAHGMRRGEVIAAKFSDIDWKKNTITVRRNAVLVGGEVKEGSPKSKRSIRTVPLSADAMRALRAARGGDGNVVSIRGKGDQYVVHDAGGRQMRPDAFARRFAVLASEAGLAPIRLHDLRHSVATHLMKIDGRAHIIARVLGHDIATLLKVYAHPTDEDARGLIDGFLGTAANL